MVPTGPEVERRGRRRGELTVAAVARLAGVSAPTVSKVLNGRAGVASSTRRRVEAVLREHGYRRPDVVGPAALLCSVFYDYSVFSLGLPLIAFFLNLIMLGWALGLLVVALLLRFGLGAENLAWFIGFMMAPISAVYYPVTTLPEWLQLVAWSLPATYVFEGMRAVLFEHRFRLDLLAGAVALNLVFLSTAFALFMAAFQSARRRGTLLQVGE